MSIFAPPPWGGDSVPFFQTKEITMSKLINLGLASRATKLAFLRTTPVQVTDGAIAKKNASSQPVQCVISGTERPNFEPCHN
jgi:hypothetical protein